MTIVPRPFEGSYAISLATALLALKSRSSSPAAAYRVQNSMGGSSKAARR